MAGPMAVCFNCLGELASTLSLPPSSEIDSFDSAVRDVTGPIAGPLTRPMAIAVTFFFFLFTSSTSFFITPNSQHLILYCFSCDLNAGMGQTLGLYWDIRQRLGVISNVHCFCINIVGMWECVNWLERWMISRDSSNLPLISSWWYVPRAFHSSGRGRSWGGKRWMEKGKVVRQ
eukprot:403130-Ditylum_brightwellii.AAC.1